VRGKRETAENNAVRIGIIKGEIEKCRKSAEILQQEIEKITGEVIDEILSQHRPHMEKAYRGCIKALREAAAAEAEVERVQETADEVGRTMGVGSALGRFTAAIQLEPTGTIRFGIRERVGQAIERAKLNDYNVE
jgi:serine/threonine-protein kinase RIO1